MKYPNLNSLVPQGEHFDESAITGEGVWLSTKHVDGIESTLGTTSNAAKDLVTANDTIQSLNTKVTDLEASAVTTQQTVNTQSTRIKELESQVATLGKQSSGTPAGTVIVSKADETNEPKPVPSYLDDNNPANQFADKHIKRSKQ